MGLPRLVLLNTPDPTKWVVAHLSNTTKLALGNSPYPTVPALLADARLRAVGDLVARHAGDPMGVRDRAGFDRLCVAVRQDNADRMRQVVDIAAEVVARYGEVLLALGRVPRGDSHRDLSEQVANLVFDGFVAATAEPHYSSLSRYLHAALVRAQNLAVNSGREAGAFETILDVGGAYAELCAAQPPGRLAPAVEEIGWQIEELRVSLFAQSLGTRHTVSAKRILKAIGACAR